MCVVCPHRRLPRRYVLKFHSTLGDQPRLFRQTNDRPILSGSFSLFRADKRRSYASMDNLALPVEKPTMAPVWFSFASVSPLRISSSPTSRLISKRLVKHDDEIVAEVLRHPSAVTSRIANDLVFFGYDLDIRTTVESIDNHI